MSQPVLTRCELDIWRNRDAQDDTQVPAAGAMVEFYHQGATVTTDSAVPEAGDAVPVFVYDSGMFEVGSLGQVAMQPEMVVRVTDAERGKLMVTSENGNPFTIDPWVRLVRLDERPSVFSDPRGTNSIGATVVASEGRLEAYVAAARFDYVISGGGLTQPRLHLDAVGGAVPSPSWLNAREFPDLQSAVAALPSLGGVVFLPAGRYVLNGTLLLDKEGITLRGQGEGTIITGPPDPGFDLVKMVKSYGRIQDLVIDGNASTDSPAVSCLVVRLVQQAYLKNVAVRRASGAGLLLQNPVGAVVMNCDCSRNRGHGIQIEKVASPRMNAVLMATNADDNEKAGVSVNGFVGDMVMLHGCAMRGNRGLTVDGSALDLTTANVQAIGCRFEWNGSGTPSGWSLLNAVNAKGLVVQGCWFVGRSGQATVKVLTGAIFANCEASAFTGNIGTELENGLAQFINGGRLIESGNRELDLEYPRIAATDQPPLGGQIMQLSNGSVGLYRYPPGAAFPDPASLPSGSMAWRDGSGPYVLDGTTWKRVVLNA